MVSQQSSGYLRRGSTRPTFLHVAYAVVLAHNLCGSRSDSREGEVMRQPVIMGLLRLEYQIARVQNRVIGLCI